MVKTHRVKLFKIFLLFIISSTLLFSGANILKKVEIAKGELRLEFKNYLPKKEIKHFCDNPKCPNHMLVLNDEKHYHNGIDEGAVGGICGILKTHYYRFKKVIPSPTFMSRGCSHTVIVDEFHLCDICKYAVDTYKEKMHE